MSALETSATSNEAPAYDLAIDGQGLFQLRIVVKIGTSVIAPDGQIDVNRMRSLVDQLDWSRHEYLIVTSGAIASGMSKLQFRDRPQLVPLMQACAAVGQSQLMYTYEQLFFGKRSIAQLLISGDDFASPARYRNLANTLHQLLKLQVVPIINENDSVSVRELVGTFGDNDQLSALLARAVGADWLLLLTDVDGLYIPNGHKVPRIMRVVSEITPELKTACNGHGRLGRGGMRSKLEAAQLVTESGIRATIVNGRQPQAISLAMQHRAGTYFPSRRRPRA